MPRAKRQESKAMSDAAARFAGIKAIADKADFGNGLTAAAYEAKIAEANAALEDYNSTLALADAKANVFELKERELRDFSERILSAVAAQYGKDSDEYEKAGGTRKSERAKPVRKAKPPTT